MKKNKLIKIYLLTTIFLSVNVFVFAARSPVPNYNSGLRFNNWYQKPPFVIDLHPVKSIKRNTCSALFVPTRTTWERLSFVDSTTASSCITRGIEKVSSRESRDTPSGTWDYETLKLTIDNNIHLVWCDAWYSPVDVHAIYWYSSWNPSYWTRYFYNKANGYCAVNNPSLDTQCWHACVNGTQTCADYLIEFKCLEWN